MSPTWATFLFELGNFLLLAALLGWLFFRPVREAIERRRAALEVEQRDAAARRAEAERLVAEARARRAELESSLSGLRERVRQEAERERASLLDGARDQAKCEREALETELAALRRSQVRAQAGDAAAAARELVARLLARIEGPELEGALLAAAGRELAGLAEAGAPAPLIVESARPLDAAALDALARAAGADAADVTARVVPELVGGVRVLTARGLVDASVAGLAAHSERALLERLDAEGDS